MSGPTDLQDAAQELLDAAVEALDTIPDFHSSLNGAPDRYFISPGEPALDCCDQLTVHVTQIQDAPLPNFGGLEAGRKVAGSINQVSFAITIGRCVPVMEEDGEPPSAEEIQAASDQTNADAWALWNHLWNLWRAELLFTFCGELFFDGMRPLAQQGGCGGWVLTIRARMDGYGEVLAS